MNGYIGIYRYGDEIRIQPTLYKTEDEARIGIQGTLGKYRSAHLKWVCEPVLVEFEEDKDV